MPRAHEATCYGGVFIQYEPSHMLRKIRSDWSFEAFSKFVMYWTKRKPKGGVQWLKKKMRENMTK